MINGGYNGKFNRHGDLIRARAKQEWSIGAIVNVGFIKGLTVREKRHDGWLLETAKGKFYVFEPHMGIFAL